jgi:hypothetical protein
MVNTPSRPVRTTSLSSPTVPQQLSIAFESLRLQGMSPSERAKVLVHLASLLIQAAGAAPEGRDDDEG